MNSPLCDSLLETKGGANKGRVEKAEGGFAIRDKATGLRGFVLPAESGAHTFTGGGQVALQIAVIDRKESDEEPKRKTPPA